MIIKLACELVMNWLVLNLLSQFDVYQQSEFRSYEISGEPWFVEFRMNVILNSLRYDYILVTMGLSELLCDYNQQAKLLSTLHFDEWLPIIRSPRLSLLGSWNRSSKVY